MPEDGRQKNIKTQGLYDRIADMQNLAMKLNGYRTSVAKYLKSLNLNIDPDSLVLDAGSGTGIVTLALRDAGFESSIIALDLSFNSLKISRDEFKKQKQHPTNADAVQSNVLKMPFANGTFDLVLMCGVLEYTPLDEGLSEAARVLKRGARLVFLPVRPSVVGTVLELLYNFRIHPIDRVRDAAMRYFNIVGNYKFPIFEPIAWSKTIFLLEKK